MTTNAGKCVCSPKYLLLLFLVLFGILFFWFDETTTERLASKMNVYSMNYFGDNNNYNTMNISKILAKNKEIEQELLVKSEELKNSKLALRNCKKIEEELNNKLSKYKKIEEKLNNKQNKLTNYKEMEQELLNKSEELKNSKLALKNYKKIEQELANKSMELIAIKAKYSKLYSQHINYSKDSIISTPSTTMNSVNNIINDNLSLKEFLKQYNISTIIGYIREIEASIYFEKIANNDDDINKLYFSGSSPHFYDGQFDLSPGKTCKVLRWYFHCTPHSVIDKAQFNEWTLRINERKLSKQSKDFLYILQRKYNFYTNIYSKFIENLKKYNSPYMEAINVYFFGNSHLQQIHQGLLCLMDNVEINIFNHSYNQIVTSYIPDIKRLNNRKPDIYNYNDTVCGELPVNGWEYHRLIKNNGLGPSFANESIFKKQRNDKNIRECTSKRAYSKFIDGTHYYMHFNHNNPKRMEKFIDVDTRFIIKNNIDEMNNGDVIREYFENQDIIIFNIGNPPTYKYYEDLEDDLKYINHTNKPVLFLGEWWDRMKNEKEIDHNNLEIINKLQNKYPNLIWLNVFKRDTEKLFIWNKTSNPFHFGKYRWIVAENEKGHLCQPGIPEHHILAITELINLLLHVYK